MKLERLPCATLLVRIHMAPRSEDRLRVLSIKDFKNKSPAYLEEKGLKKKRPEYKFGVYNTQYCEITDAEKALFVHR